MSRSYIVLAAALVGVAGLAGIAGVAHRDDVTSVASPAPATAVPAGDRTVPNAATAPAGSDVVSSTSDPAAAAGEDGGVVVPATSTTSGADATACTVTKRLEVDTSDPEVACLEAHLVLAGMLTDATPDDLFDPATDAAVKAFQGANDLVVDGIVGPQTAKQLGAWSGPDVLPPDASTCPTSGRSAVVDRFNQRSWLCDDGVITDEMPITSAVSQPDPGTYEVYAKDLDASSTLTGDYSTMHHFVAFTYGKYQGARIAFHSLPQYSNGEYVQPIDSVGTQELFGASSGCIRVLPDDATLIWDWLDIGDTVVVIS